MAWLLWLVACSGPVEGCDTTGIDCCTSDDECVDWYGDAFGYCATPGRQTGICAECATGDDCSTYETCVEDPVVGAWCAARE